jgi:hypothetical protein
VKFDLEITITCIIIALRSALHQVKEDTGGYFNVSFGRISFVNITVRSILPRDDLEECLVAITIISLYAVNLSFFDRHGSVQAALLDPDFSRLPAGNYQSNGCEEIIPGKIHDLREILGMFGLCIALRLAISLGGIRDVSCSQLTSSSETRWHKDTYRISSAERLIHLKKRSLAAKTHHRHAKNYVRRTHSNSGSGFG